ncbi:MAG: leucine-rich repeat domain-containing protein, partial [Candidatus Coproplasma sp.]
TPGNFWHYDTDGKTIVKWQSIEDEEGEEIEQVAGTPGLEYTLSGGKYSCTGIGTATDTVITIASHYNDIEVTSIGSYAFANCEFLIKVEIPNSIITIGPNAFSNCTSLAEVSIPDSVTLIRSSAFENCTSLTSITIPDGVTMIDMYAFSGCSSLETISMSENIRTIGSNAFYNCTKLLFNEYDNAIYLGNESNPYVALINAKSTYITSCIINSGTKTICYAAFENCSSLTSISIPTGVNVIDAFAFKDCSSLSSVDIPSTITLIGSYAFENCSSLESFSVPSDLKTLSNDVFDGCTSLQYTEYEGGLYLGNSSNAYIVLVKVISTGITSFKINTNTKFIGSKAFEGCTSLTSIVIPDSVTQICYKAFKGCTALENVTVGDSVTTLSYYAFDGCTALKNIIIGKSLKTINGSAFDSSAEIETVYYNGTAEEWAKVSVGSTVPFGNATIYYYSETEPTTAGNFWHYDTDGKTILVWGE